MQGQFVVGHAIGHQRGDLGGNSLLARMNEADSLQADGCARDPGPS
jgi:hypothetical protein